jgi:hypothetical protein
VGGFLIETKNYNHMSEDLLTSKIELLEEQIDNLEKSGFFTEQEINSRSISIRAHLSLLKNVLQLYKTSREAKTAADAMLKLGRSFDEIESLVMLNFEITKESYEAGKKIHEMYFSTINPIPVKPLEILTPIQQEA